MFKQIEEVLRTQSGQIWQAIGEHIAISLISLLIACLIAIPLAIALMNHHRIAEFFLQVAGVFQTIPSLAILGILIPFVGIGTVPAIIALVIYAIMPLFQNTYAGLTDIDPSLEEAATAFGLSRSRKLFRLELPLAMPMILSGLRIATVMIIGTATLAALIGAGGLGTYIILGIENNNNALLLIGAVLSAILAIVFSALIRLLERVHFTKRGVIVTLCVFLIACGAGAFKYFAPSQQTITIAGKMGSEPEILINMYKDLIQQESPKTKVVVKPNFGGTSFLFKALESKQIDVYPEFTGTVLQAIVKEKGKTPHNPEVTYKKAKTALAKDNQMTYLKPMAYQNGYDLAVSRSFAKKYHLKTISDLAKVGDKATAAFDPDFYHQADGYPGLKKAYGLHIGTVKTMESSIRYEAIADHRVNVVDGYTTDPEIQKDHLVVLKDNKHFFPPYQGAPLMTTTFADRHPEVKRALSKLAGKITTTDMQKMNYDVTFKHEKAATVARHYLKTHGLLN